MSAVALESGHGVRSLRIRAWERAQPLALAVSVVILGFLLAVLPLKWALLLVLGAFFSAVLFFRPAFGLYGLAFTIPFGSLWRIPLGPGIMGPSELLLGAALASWLIRVMVRRETLTIGRTEIIAVAILLYVFAVSLLRAENTIAAVVEWLKWAEFLALYLFVGQGLSDAEKRLLVAALLIAGAGQALLGIYQFLRQVGPSEFVLLGRYMRASGTFEQPNPFGAYMGLVLPLGYGIGIAYLPKRGKDGLARNGLWLLACAAGALLMLGLIMSWSRGALLGMTVGLGIVLVVRYRRYWPLAIVSALVLLMVGPQLVSLVPGDLLERLLDVTRYAGKDLTAIEITDANFAVIERTAHWQAAWRMFESNPWLGVGIGQYPVRYAEFAVPRWEHALGHAHNIYLNVLAENGLAGLTAYSLMMGLFAWRTLRASWVESGWRQALALAALGMLGHLCVHSLVDNLYVHQMYLLMAMMLALVPRGIVHREG